MPTKRGLVIGINAYPKLPVDKQLTGCVHDARLMHDILQKPFGFAPEHLTLILDAEATRERILGALQALVDATQPGDPVVLYFAGHGGRMTDLEYDEPSGYDSTLVTHDSGSWRGDNRDITDDEFSVHLEALAARTSCITLIFDCCHSGTITRDVGSDVKTRSVPADTRSREELLKERTPLQQQAPRPSGPSGWFATSEAHVLIAGCRDAEESAEYHARIDGTVVPHGALTWYLTRQLLLAGPTTTYRDVFEPAAAQVTAYNSAQHPQMEGKADRALFGLQEFEPERYVPVDARTGMTVALAVGAVHGVTRGSTYHVYPQGTRRPQGTPAGELRVTSTSAFTAEAEIVTESAPDAVAPGTRAFPVSSGIDDQPLAVVLPAGSDPAVTALRTVLAPSRLLQLDAPGGEAVTITLVPARAAVSETDPVPRAGPLRSPRWAITSPTGDLVAPLKAIGEEADILANLEKLAKYRRGLAITNPDPNSSLQGRFTLELLRVDAAGTPTVALPDASGQVVYDEGDLIAFRITSTHDRPVFLTLMDFGISGGVTSILPYKEARAQVELRANGTFDYDVRPGKVFDVRWPKNFPFVDTVDHGREAFGVDTVRLFVTEKATDFSVMQQVGMRSTGTRLGDLLTATFNGPVTRDIGRDDPVDTDWTVVTRSFVVRRRQAQVLDARSTAVRIGDATVTAPGLTGTVRAHLGPEARAAAAADLAAPLRAALAEHGVRDGQSLEVTDARESGVATRSVGAEPALELTLREPGPDEGQLVMAVDEMGLVSWVFAERTRGGGERRYVVPRSVPTEPAGQPATRGIVSSVGKKILKELIFPLIDPVLGEISEQFVGRMEARKWPYRLRGFTPETYTQDVAAPVDFAQLARGRALLFVHGTFSRAHLAFCGLSPEAMAELHRRYEGRVFAFDHFTLSHDPRENIRRFVTALPEGIALDVDIVCHSRGGLVSRFLAEQWNTFDVGRRSLKVGRVVFVGSPNAGTPLADTARVGDLLDVVTNVLDALPDNGVTDTLAMVVGVAKQVAVASAKGLDGLMSMDPQGPFTRDLNTAARRTDARYFAVTSQAAAQGLGVKRLLVTKGLEKLMGGASDLVVPTDGVFAANGSGTFPITERLLLSGADGVTHTQYFTSEQVRRALLQWLA